MVDIGHCDFVDVDECASNPCSNGSTCEDNDNAYTCTCAAGFHGANCDISMTFMYFVYGFSSSSLQIFFFFFEMIVVLLL